MLLPLLRPAFTGLWMSAVYTHKCCFMVKNRKTKKITRMEGRKRVQRRGTKGKCNEEWEAKGRDSTNRVRSDCKRILLPAASFQNHTLMWGCDILAHARYPQVKVMVGGFGWEEGTLPLPSVQMLESSWWRIWFIYLVKPVFTFVKQEIEVWTAIYCLK